jgi:hypothetical protein
MRIGVQKIFAELGTSQRDQLKEVTEKFSYYYMISIQGGSTPIFSGGVLEIEALQECIS